MTFVTSCLGTLSAFLPGSERPRSDQPLLRSGSRHPDYAAASASSTATQSYPPTTKLFTDQASEMVPAELPAPLCPGTEAGGQGRAWVEGCTFCDVGEKEGFNVVYQVSSDDWEASGRVRCDLRLTLATSLAFLPRLLPSPRP